MTRARPVFEDESNLVTRRCHRREFLLPPIDEVRNLFGYLAAVLAQERGIDIFCLVVEPNHHHGVTNDKYAVLPKFTQDFHGFSARALNRLFDDEGSVWNCSQTSHVALEEPCDILDKIIYALCNPVQDGLVEDAGDYTGLRISWLDGPQIFTRPNFWFSPKAKKKDGSKRWPDKVALMCARPPGFEDRSDDELRALLEERLRAREAAARAEHSGDYIGAETLQNRPRHDWPKTRKPRSKISPTVAAKDRHRRLARLIFNAAWRQEHADALAEFIAGNRDVVFPYGTYKMRVIYGVNVAPPPT